ncbi:hypothetical protein J6590_073355 [Homalodisca vitripennis]|nr:hypothetical protein J6590_073355 [Homalodisca vitripennis]
MDEDLPFKLASKNVQDLDRIVLPAMHAPASLSEAGSSSLPEEIPSGSRIFHD